MKTIIFLILLTVASISAEVITASKLSREFQVNELRANANYKNKIVIIKGAVKRVETGNNKSYYWIVLKGDSFLSSVYILFPTNDGDTLKKARQLKSGDLIAVKALICEKDSTGDVKCSGDTFISAIREKDQIKQKTVKSRFVPFGKEFNGAHNENLKKVKLKKEEIKPFKILPKYGTITLKSGKVYHGKLIERTNEGISIKTSKFKAFYKWELLSDETVQKYKLD